jgi:hypothetical protein
VAAGGDAVSGPLGVKAHDGEFGRVGEAPQPAATGADSMAGMGCREATPSNSNFLAALHSSLEQAHEARVGEL